MEKTKETANQPDEQVGKTEEESAQAAQTEEQLEAEEKQPDETQKQLEQLQKQLTDYQDRELRQRAEFDNFRKRTQREKEELYSSATADCIMEFLAVLDNLERALAADAGESDLRSGVEMTANQFRQALEKLGVQEIPAQGEPFDPNRHNAVNTVEDESYGENTVCQVFQKGYAMGDKVLRHAMVVVANP